MARCTTACSPRCTLQFSQSSSVAARPRCRRPGRWVASAADPNLLQGAHLPIGAACLRPTSARGRGPRNPAHDARPSRNALADRRNSDARLASSSPPSPSVRTVVPSEKVTSIGGAPSLGRRVKETRPAFEQRPEVLGLLRTGDFTGLDVDERVCAVTEDTGETKRNLVDLLALHRLDRVPPQPANRCHGSIVVRLRSTVNGPSRAAS